MKTIPNYISISRIFLVVILIFIKPLNREFFIIYILCGLSDIMDGFIARKTETTSMLGAKLDSIADMIMIVVLFIFYPIVNLSNEIYAWIILIGVIRVIGMIIALKKYGTFVSIHTYGNKFTGFVLFLFPILLLYIDITILAYAVCIIATISALEELVIQLISIELKINKKSIFK